jgi:hypothetical protein
MADTGNQTQNESEGRTMKTIAKRNEEGFCGSMNRFILAVCLLSTLTGCSVFMAAKLPDKKNLEVFTPGVPRPVVLAEMGLPAGYEDRNGVRSEVYKFKQGYSQEAKISRAVLHGTADILTFGLWEAVGTPTEYYFSGKDTIVLVTYNQNDRVEAVKYFQGGEQGK